MKTIAKNTKYLSYLFWLGPILCIVGLTARAVAGEWSPIILGLFVAGLVIIGLWLVFLGSLAPGFWGRRSTQVGTNAVIATLAMLVILGLVNFLGVRYGERIDLTENQLYTLSPQSQRIVENLQQPVKVWVFDPNANQSDRDLLKNYRRYGSKLEYEFVDAQLRPSLAQKFNVQSPGQVFLEYGNQRQLVQTVSAGERLSEVKLTNGIERVTSDRTDKVYFLQGHGERPMEAAQGSLSLAVSALKDKNFTAQPLNLAERLEVPKDASLVVIAGPKRALLQPEVQALKTYLLSGGSLLVMVDPETNAGLDTLLADWGVKLDTRIAIDASGQGRAVGLGPGTALVANYGNHPITKDFGNQFSLYPLARPVETTPVNGVKESPLVITDSESWGESSPEKQPLQFEPKEGDRPGPLTLAVALSRPAVGPSAVPTPKPQTTPSPGASPSPSPSGQPAASATPIAQITPSPSASPSPSPSGQPAASATPIGQTTPSPSASPSPSPSGQPTASATPIAQTTPSLGASPSVSPSGQPQASPSANKENAEKRSSESRLVVFGNSNFATDGWFEQQLNSDVLLNSISWLSNRDEQALSIRPREQKNRRLNLTQAQAGALGWTALAIMPLVGFTTAGLMWWRRR
jgi:ABC-type uncharacterized transport system involved in gliding motility auxiliary subunit